MYNCQIGLFAVINLRDQPGLAALLEEDETLDYLMKLSPERILLRWVNYQLRQSGCDRQITNLTTDIQDSVVYIHLINTIAPPELGVKVNTDALHVSQLEVNVCQPARKHKPARCSFCCHDPDLESTP